MTKEEAQRIHTEKNNSNHSIILKKNTVYVSLFILGLFICLFGYGSLNSTYYLQQTRELKVKTAQLKTELETSSEQFTLQLTEIRNTLARITREKEALSQKYQQQEKKHKNLLESSISRLDNRTKVIKTVIDQLGVTIKEDPDHSGGPYIAPQENFCNKLICTSDRYLTALQDMPLGRPIDTRISSGFGKRIDPLNKKRAFHSGIDFRGETGDKIRATGNAVVKKSAYNKGLGYYIILRHGNGYETVFAHLSKRLVKEGEKIRRGQVIGLLGNTGRSTGSHLHYEVRRYGKAINPMKYLKVADLTVTASR